MELVSVLADSDLSAFRDFAPVDSGAGDKIDGAKPFLSMRAPILLNSIRSVCEVSAAAESRKYTIGYELNGQAIQFISDLDFLSIQAYRLWMEHPSREKVKSGHHRGEFIGAP